MITEKERQEYRNLTQQTPEWVCARRGRIGSSRCADVIGKVGKGDKIRYGAARYDYLMEILVEHITGRAIEHYVSQAMEWGIEQQIFAEAAYSTRQGVMVESVGLIVHPEIELFSCSPDGLVGDEGLVEFKCPTTRVHLEYLEAGDVPEEYIPQLNGQLACMPEREWVDFCSFDPRVPFGMQLFIRRHHRDRERIAELEKEVGTFLEEVEAKVKSLTTARPIVTELVAG